MKVSKIISVTILYAYTNFACQPPQPPRPPKPPAIKRAASDDDERQSPLPPSWSPTAPMLAMYNARSKKGASITYDGILRTNSDGGRLKCKVTYDPATDSYSGEKINDRFSAAEWYSSEMGKDRAKELYLDLAQQDPDQTKKMG